MIDNIKAQDVPMNQLSYLHACLPTCMLCSHLFTLYGLRDNIISGTGTFMSKHYLPSPVNQIFTTNKVAQCYNMRKSVSGALSTEVYSTCITCTPNCTDIEF